MFEVESEPIGLAESCSREIDTATHTSAHWNCCRPSITCCLHSRICDSLSSIPGFSSREAPKRRSLIISDSSQSPAPVNHVNLPGRKGGLIGSKIDGKCSDFSRLAKTPHGLAGDEFGASLLKISLRPHPLL